MATLRATTNGEETMKTAASGMAAALMWMIAGVPAWAGEPAFVPPSQINALQVLAGPPGADSGTTRAELIELHRLQSQRTPSQVMRAVGDDRNETIFLFRDVMGPDFNAATLPITAALGASIHGDEEINTDPAKHGFGRVRPYNLDRSLHPVCRTKTANDSYPSGHATTGYLLALTLIDMVPEKRDAILARADDYAQNRLICGVHYSSDLAAGRLIAYAMHAVMSNNPRYQQALAAARQELGRASAARQ